MSIRIAVMLSHPTSLIFELRQLSNNFVSTSFELLLSLLNLRISSTIPSQFSTYFYHTPSQPIRINSSLPVSSIYSISGRAVTFCFYGGKPSFFLYYKSPMARLRFKPPSMRPIDTVPPAPIILAYYSGFSGLWSNDS